MPVSTWFSLTDTPMLGRRVDRAAATLPQTATTAFYTVSGIVIVRALVLVVTTAVQAQANAVKWRFTPTGGSVGDVSGTVDINGAAVGSLVIMEGPTAAGAASQAPQLLTTTGSANAGILLHGGLLLPAGALGLNAAASSTGAVRGILYYQDFDGNGTVVAA
jgi:hypothetical protein